MSGPLTVAAIITLGLVIYLLLNFYPPPKPATTQPATNETVPTTVEK